MVSNPNHENKKSLRPIFVTTLALDSRDAEPVTNDPTVRR